MDGPSVSSAFTGRGGLQCLHHLYLLDHLIKADGISYWQNMVRRFFSFSYRHILKDIPNPTTHKHAHTHSHLYCFLCGSLLWMLE